jgi:two-component sensor histidine kinase
MALIHEKLYRSPSLSLVDFNAYIHDLASRLTQAYATVPVEVRIAAENVFLPVDIAVPCGLIINELFTNSLKHGFSGGGEKGGNQRIDISMVSEADGTTVLSVIDNGAGIPPHLNAREPESLGLQIVAGLTEQLDGTFTLEGGAGTVARVVFTLPMEERGSGEAAASGSKAPA